MICKKCGYNMRDESDFCMNCGAKVENTPVIKIQPSPHGTITSNIVCRYCGKTNPEKSFFCVGCGRKIPSKHLGKFIAGTISAFLVICLVICILFMQNKGLKSPIEGVSQKVYSQGQEYLEKMDTSVVKDAVAKYVNTHSDVKMNEVYKNMGGVDFTVELGKNATTEEEYYAALIDKFWESKAICYAHEAIMAQYKDSDETAVQMATTLYKGVVSDFEDGIDEAEEVLKGASNIEDMKEAYQILDSIWESGD